MIAILRLSPIILPLIAIAATNAGLWSSIGSGFDLDNAAFATFAASLFLVLPGLIMGFVLLAFDCLNPERHQIWIAFLLASSFLIASAGFAVGAGLNF